MDRYLNLAIIAGESSGDLHGFALMRALRKLYPNIRFAGKGGPKMKAEAIASGGSMEDWIAQAGVVGIWDVLIRYAYFKKKFNTLLEEINKHLFDAVIFVDFPGFNVRLAKAIRKRKIPTKIIYYISPQVWAWNRKRIPIIAQALDLMICIFPFEKAIYLSSGLPTVFAGHPMGSELHAVATMERDPRLLGLFPGSRDREVRKIFPLMLAATKRILCARTDLRVQVAAATHAHALYMSKVAKAYNLDITITTGKSQELMRKATVALICSGTATLEAAFLGLPYALVYKVATLTYLIASFLIKVPYLGIVNILANRSIIKEFIQHKATPEALADETLRLLNSTKIREDLAQDLISVVSKLKEKNDSPHSERVATAVLHCIGIFEKSCDS